ncbi:peptidoglycan recognition protein family protein [Flavobacterium rhizosphaerae]|uniref:N-acetylmuramoyl-L-alanine amidase n=1 Tax=Flavobacterium rhizosphaerae TaxID=3163298 RepID=A0ABW8YRI9_9FLAO
MAYSLIWLSDVLKDAGLKVAECQGWKTSGVGEMVRVEGVMCHHTATTNKNGNMPSLNTIINGRPDLRGPLSQLGLGRDGTFYIIAAGRCNHAGRGEWNGVSGGNSHFIGIEAENMGTGQEPWPEVQMDAYRRGVAAILKKIGKGVEACAGHKEYAQPAGRKPDPNFDMDAFRAEVGRIMRGENNAVLIPAEECVAVNPRATLRRGIANDAALVKIVQSKVGAVADGFFGPKTEAKVREFQRLHGAVPDGIVGPKTWKLIDSN